MEDPLNDQLIADDNCWKFGFEIHPCLHAQAKRANSRIIYLDERGFSLYLLNAGINLDRAEPVEIRLAFAIVFGTRNQPVRYSIFPLVGS